MMTTNEVGQVFDTILSSPGMSETVRIDMKISRKAVLLLQQIITIGLSEKTSEEGVLLAQFVSPETQEELIALGSEWLHKAGLTELSEKLMNLGSNAKKQ